MIILARYVLGAIALLLSTCALVAQSQKQLVRLAVIEVDADVLPIYNELLKEEIESSIRIETGVLTLYAVAEKDNPTHVTLFETYADSAQYRAHLNTPHFQKYKTGTLPMVKDLKLIESTPLLYSSRISLTTPVGKDVFVRLIRLQIDSHQLKNYETIVRDVMQPGITKESGILAMYAVSMKAKPESITVLEVYKDAAAYEKHIRTKHFKKYKAATKEMIKDLQIIDAVPIFLGAKPQP